MRALKQPILGLLPLLGMGLAFSLPGRSDPRAALSSRGQSAEEACPPPVCAYAALPNDVYYPETPGDNIVLQWYLENRKLDGTRAGMDLNARAAWPFSQGEGITVAVVDSGLELDHPELIKRVNGPLHYNFHALN